MKLNLVKIINSEGKISYQGLTEDQLERVQDTQSAYTYIDRKYQFELENLGNVDIFIDKDDIEYSNELHSTTEDDDE